MAQKILSIYLTKEPVKLVLLSIEKQPWKVNKSWKTTLKINVLKNNPEK